MKQYAVSFIYIQVGEWAPFHFPSWKLWKTEHDGLLCSLYHVSSTEHHVKEEIITSLNKEIYGEGLEVLDHKDLEGQFIKEEL